MDIRKLHFLDTIQRRFYFLVNDQSTISSFPLFYPKSVPICKPYAITAIVIEDPMANKVASKAKEIDPSQKLDLYYTPGSPPCRLVMLVAAYLDVPLNLIEVDLSAEDQMRETFMRLNPQHTVPTIVDGNYVLWESRAIARYLVNKYQPGCTLYPNDLEVRGKIDQRIDFDLGLLCPSFSQYFYPPLFKNAEPTPDKQRKLNDSLKFLNIFLGSQSYAASEEFTLADLCLIVTVSTIQAAGIDLNPFKNILTWLDRVKPITPGYKEINEKGLNEFRKLVAQVKKVRSKIPFQTNTNPSWSRRSSGSVRFNEDVVHSSDEKPPSQGESSKSKSASHAAAIINTIYMHPDESNTTDLSEAETVSQAKTSAAKNMATKVTRSNNRKSYEKNKKS